MSLPESAPATLAPAPSPVINAKDAASIQFLIAVFLFHEEMNATRMVSFALIWLSLAVFSWDSFRRRPRAVAA